MSYKWRKEQKLFAHEILEKLWREAVKRMSSGNGDPVPIELFNSYTLKENEFSAKIAAYSLLLENGHVVTDKDSMTKAEIQPKGVEAYHSGYYHVENRKDQLESVEYITKWIIPVLSCNSHYLI